MERHKQRRKIGKREAEKKGWIREKPRGRLRKEKYGGQNEQKNIYKKIGYMYFIQYVQLIKANQSLILGTS